MNLRTSGSFKSINKIKRLCPQANPKSAMCHIFGRSANLTNYLSSQICGDAELICGPPTFGPVPQHSTDQLE